MTERFPFLCDLVVAGATLQNDKLIWVKPFRASACVDMWEKMFTCGVKHF